MIKPWLVKPWLYLPSHISYKLAPLFLKIHGMISPFQSLTWSPFSWRGLHFKNPLGLSGGVDKNAKNIKNWWTFGPGFIELGTVTPLSQKKNFGKVLDHNLYKEALWNYLGFPNQGVKALEKQLLKLSKPYFTPIFINIGKNRKTKNKEATKDYIQCIKNLYLFADAFVINISSPNTEDLRELAKPDTLKDFLLPLLDFNRNLPSKSLSSTSSSLISSSFPSFSLASKVSIPILIKLSPDHEREEFEKILELSLALGVDGWIVTNSLKASQERCSSLNLDFPNRGGISGRPLKDLSLANLKWLIQFVKSFVKDRREKLIVSSGGVLSPEDVFERLKIGADLVQVYSALVFKGPFFFRKVNKMAQSRK